MANTNKNPLRIIKILDKACEDNLLVLPRPAWFRVHAWSGLILDSKKL